MAGRSHGEAATAPVDGDTTRADASVGTFGVSVGTFGDSVGPFGVSVGLKKGAVRTKWAEEETKLFVL